MKECAYIILLFWAGLLISCSENTGAGIERGRNYYLSNSGNDSAEGSRLKPWKTLAKLNVTHLAAGDSVFLRSSDVFNGSLILKEIKGTEIHPVVITSYGSGVAVINAHNSGAVKLSYSGFIEMSRLVAMGSGRKNGNNADGIAVLSSNNIRIDSMEVTGFREAGLAVYSSSYISITKVHSFDNGYAGISVMGNSKALKRDCHTIYIAHCNAENNPGSPFILNNHSGNGIIAGYCTNVTIERCIATNNGWDMPRTGNGPVGIWLFEADSSLIQYCISHHNKTSKGGEDGGGYDLDGGVTNSVIQYCESYENEGSGFGLFQYKSATPWYNNTIRFNTSRNDGAVSAARAGLYVWNEQDDSVRFRNCSVHDNTIYNEKVAAISFSPLSIRSGFHFYNNKLTGKGKVITDKGKPCHDLFNNNEIKPL